MATSSSSKPVEPDDDRRDAAINIRLSAKLRDLIDTAATLAGKTRSEFILESARQHAVDVLLDQRLFSLGEESYASFIAALDNPPEPPKKLKVLFKERAPWER